MKERTVLSCTVLLLGSKNQLTVDAQSENRRIFTKIDLGMNKLKSFRLILKYDLCPVRLNKFTPQLFAVSN